MAGGHLKSLTDRGKSPEVRECTVCLRNRKEAGTAQREQGTGQQKFRVEGSQSQPMKSIMNYREEELNDFTNVLWNKSNKIKIASCM